MCWAEELGEKFGHGGNSALHAGLPLEGQHELLLYSPDILF